MRLTSSATPSAEAEQHHRYRSRAAAQREREAALAVTDEQRHHRRRVVDRVDPDAEDDPRAEQQCGEPTVLPSADHEAGEAGGHDEVAHRIVRPEARWSIDAVVVGA